MNLALAFLLVIIGFALLWKAADFLVGGAVTIAERFNIAPLVIGMTVVAMGTSAPEVAASVAATLRHAGDAAIGNVYGSNIANLALIGGVIALIRPVQVRLKTMKFEVPFMILSAIVLWFTVRNTIVSRFEGIALLIFFAFFIFFTVRNARKIDTSEIAHNKTTQQKKNDAIGKSIMLVAGGLFGLAIGADIAVRGAVAIGEAFGLSEAVIGLTIIAIGTSLPELVTCVVACLKGQDDISIGNLVGSNIFNTLLVVGAAGAVKPMHLAERLAGFDFIIMLSVSFLFLVLIVLGKLSLRRSGGAALMVVYVAYIAYLLMCQ